MATVNNWLEVRSADRVCILGLDHLTEIGEQVENRYLIHILEVCTE